MSDRLVTEAYFKCRDLDRYLERHRWDYSEEVLDEVRERFSVISDLVRRAAGYAPDCHTTNRLFFS